MTRNVLWCLVSVILTVFPVTAQTQGQADRVFKNGFIYTVNAHHGQAQALAIKDGKFIKVGSNEEMRSVTGTGTEVVDLGGKMVMPGISDNHIHPVRGGLAHLNFCSFPSTLTIAQIQDRVKGCVADKNPGDWIEGSKWSAGLVTQVDASMLDQVAPDNPVLLHDNSNHLIWVNSAALQTAGITKETPDPAGGKIIRDSNGNPTGALTEKAAVLVTKHMPAPSQAQIEQAAKWIFDKLSAYGVTAIQTAQADAGRVRAYRDLEKKGDLTVRLKLRWDWNTRYAPVGLDEMAARFATRKQRGPRTAFIDPDGVKIYTDGVPNGHGSPFIEPYADGDGTNFGNIYLNQPQLSSAVTKFDADGLSVMFHAVGDQAVHNTLNAIAAARAVNGSGGPRHHISHVFMVHPDDLGRATKLNVSQEASPIDVLYPGDMTMVYAATLGRERVNRTMPVKSLVDAGGAGRLGYGSDWDNVPEPDPWLALETMITRRNPDAPSLGQTSPHEAVDLVTGLEILTYGGAFSMGLEKVTGSIEVGKDADLIVLNQNLFEIPANKIHETRVLLTVLQGKTVYQAK